MRSRMVAGKAVGGQGAGYREGTWEGAREAVHVNWGNLVWQSRQEAVTWPGKRWWMKEESSLSHLQEQQGHPALAIIVPDGNLFDVVPRYHGERPKESRRKGERMNQAASSVPGLEM